MDFLTNPAGFHGNFHLPNETLKSHNFRKRPNYFHLKVLLRYLMVYTVWVPHLHTFRSLDCGHFSQDIP